MLDCFFIQRSWPKSSRHQKGQMILIGLQYFTHHTHHTPSIECLNETSNDRMARLTVEFERLATLRVPNTLSRSTLDQKMWIDQRDELWENQE